jgi:hypothetical protein
VIEFSFSSLFSFIFNPDSDPPPAIVEQFITVTVRGCHALALARSALDPQVELQTLERRLRVRLFKVA